MDDTCMLMLEQMVLLARFVSVLVPSRGEALIEVYGDRGTLVLGSDNQKDYVHGFRLWGPAGQPMAANSRHLAFPQTYPMVALHRLSG